MTSPDRHPRRWARVPVVHIGGAAPSPSRPPAATSVGPCFVRQRASPRANRARRPYTARSGVEVLYG